MSEPPANRKSGQANVGEVSNVAWVSEARRCGFALGRRNDILLRTTPPSVPILPSEVGNLAYFAQ